MQVLPDRRTLPSHSDLALSDTCTCGTAAIALPHRNDSWMGPGGTRPGEWAGSGLLLDGSGA